MLHNNDGKFAALRFGDPFAMWQIDSLLEYYKYVFLTQGPTPLAAKLSLGLVLYIVWAGNEKPGQKLLAIVFGTQALVAAFLAVGQMASLSVLLAALALAVGAGMSLASPWRWLVLPEDPAARMAAWTGYVAAFTMPFWPRGSFIGQIFFSPMGSLPHQGVAVLLVLCAVSGATRPRPLHLAGLLAALVLAVGDLLGGNVPIGVMMILFSIVGLIPLVQTGGLVEALNDEKQRLAEMARGDAEGSGKAAEPGRKWDLK